MAAAHEPTDAFVLERPEHFKALGHPVRHRVVNVLRQRPATLRQLTEALSLAKGTVAYHVGVLHRAGMVHVVETRRVRGGTEQYLGLVSDAFTFQDGDLGAEFLYRSARAEMLPERPEGAEQTSLRHLWLTPDQAHELWGALRRSATATATEVEVEVEADGEAGGERTADGRVEGRAGSEAYGLLISLYRADIPLLPPDEPAARTAAAPESPHVS